MDKYVVIGDIHGDLEKLNKFLYNKYKKRKYIFIGDYINRGEKSYEVIEALINFKKFHPESIFLLGNHDYALIKYLKDGNFFDFASIGGIPTLKSYIVNPYGNIHHQFIQNLPKTHVRFFSSLNLFFEDDSFFISHSGVNPDNIEGRTVRDLIFNNDFQKIKNVKYKNKLIICGHFLQKTMKPYLSENLICIDTGCGSVNGPLSWILLPEKEVFMYV